MRMLGWLSGKLEYNLGKAKSTGESLQVESQLAEVPWKSAVQGRKHCRSYYIISPRNETRYCRCGAERVGLHCLGREFQL